MTTEDILSQKLDRLIAALERIAPPEAKTPDLDAADCFVWAPERLVLDPVSRVNRVDIALIRGVDLVRDQLVDNTRRFAKGFPANNVLLWGARGMGKSSLVKAAQASVNAEFPDITPLKLVEIHREDIDSLPVLMNLIKETRHRFILFCDDLSFDHDDTSYKSLKAALEGGVEGRPDNVIFYATSNRRHLMPRDMIDNERSTAINPQKPSRKRFHCRTASACGSAFINAARTIILP
ncbi:ATP-dependent protease subunit [Brucella abortus]|nr:ATP-dependent protease subunit [Brucella abortus]